MFVPWDGQVVTIDSIGPSSAHELLSGCRMKAVLSKHPNSENCHQGIPVHPNSSIGTIFHRLLEGARRNRPPNGSDNWTVEHAKSVLENLTEAENQKLESDNLNAHLTPLQTKQDYFSRSMYGIFAAVEQNNQTTPGAGQSNLGTSSQHTLFGAEISVWDLEENWPHNLGNSEAPDFSIYGQIDRVTRNGNRVVIEDIKTGKIFDENRDLKSSYITQLKLYAELWILTARHRHGMDSYSMSDIDMFIVDDMGTRHPITSNTQDNISNQIRNVLSETNQIILNSVSNNELIRELANPNPNSCRFCRHRTGCDEYLTELIDNAGFVEDGFDLIGDVVSNPIPNAVGSEDFQMKVEAGSDLWLVDKIKGQWIEQTNPQIGDTIGIFGGVEVADTPCLNFNRFFKCSLNQQAIYQISEQ